MKTNFKGLAVEVEKLFNTARKTMSYLVYERCITDDVLTDWLNTFYWDEKNLLETEVFLFYEIRENNTTDLYNKLVYLDNILHYIKTNEVIYLEKYLFNIDKYIDKNYILTADLEYEIMKEISLNGVNVSNDIKKDFYEYDNTCDYHFRGDWNTLQPVELVEIVNDYICIHGLNDLYNTYLDLESLNEELENLEE